MSQNILVNLFLMVLCRQHSLAREKNQTYKHNCFCSTPLIEEIFRKPNTLHLNSMLHLVLELPSMSFDAVSKNQLKYVLSSIQKSMERSIKIVNNFMREVRFILIVIYSKIRFIQLIFLGKF